MTSADWFIVLAVFVCLLLSAFFSGSETALTASSRASMLRLEKQGNRRARIVNRLLDARERMLGALLLSNNAVTVAASSLATGLLLAWFGDVGVIYATVVMTIVIVVFSEILPKTAAINTPERVALAVARPMAWIVRLLSPVLMAIEAFVRRLLRLFGINVGENQAILSAHEELRGAVDLLHREGSVEKLDRDMFGGVLDLRELEVSDVMVHRIEMTTINADEPPEDVMREVLASQYTRYPLWREKPENIVGILHAKNLLRAIQEGEGDLSKLDIMELALPPWFVPETRPLSEQLKAFRRRKTHFALVVDEYGEVMGMVTLEDILEEIVGDISDEHDVVVPGVHPQLDGAVNVDGAVPIRDLNRAMDWNLPDAEATTIAGLVIHEARSIPDVGQSFTFHGFRFRVLGKERNRITALRIAPLLRQPAVTQISMPPRDSAAR
ncbi:MAG: HlyC/CorC family transporter [Pseudomonadota bacterium]|nr:HlyC/CorC family transporter [Pseudomonadota bacterium]